ncbi:MAG: ABC transporter ATP-binding protein [Bdellovibrionales bacterium]|nr:ABC transporter ATP-binding protein [Bdellovibrionales bacterium]
MGEKNVAPANVHTEVVLKAKELRKSLNEKHIVRGLSFDLRQGDSVGLLGLNGAGKTTTLRLLSTLLEPDSGELLFNGIDVRQCLQLYRDSIGYLADDARLYNECTVEEHLTFLGKLRGLRSGALRRELERVYELCDLRAVHSILCGNLSRGFRQRVGLASALLHRPILLFLDEPAGALDPQQREHFRRLLSTLRREAVTVVHSSHILQDVSVCCERLLVIDEGECVADLRSTDDLQELEKQFFAAVTSREDRSQNFTVRVRRGTPPRGMAA